MRETRAAELHAMRTSVEQLASVVEMLRRDLRQLSTDEAEERRVVTAPVPAPPRAVPPPPPPPAPAPGAAIVPRPSVPRAAERRFALPDLETLVGRYGSIALAAVSIVAGVAVFLGWAVRHGLLGPEARVALGALAAAALGVAGRRLRARGTRRFGAALLTLALAVAHADAWGAGPRLHVVPDVVAFVAAALASELLVLVAVRDEDQFLFCVGVAGALLAPFLTWDGASTVTLLAYGWTVLATAIRAVRRRRWSPADMLAVVGCAAYAVFGALQAERPGTGPLAAAAPALLALGCAWTALARGAHSRQARAALAHLLIALVTIGLSAGAVGPVGAPLFAALALAATATVYLVPARGFCAPDLWRASMLLAPAVYLAVALSTFRDALSLGGAAAAAAWAVAATAAAWRTSARRRGPHVAFATLSSALALAIALHEHPAVCAAALAAHATLAVLLLRRVDSRALLGAAVGVLACASLWALGLLRGDAPFESIPFGGAPSLAALLAAVGWWTIAASPEVARLARQARPDARRGETVPARWKLFGLAAAYTFWWWRLELAGAFSPDAATFLLVAYYAAAGVAVVAAGRRVGVAPVRRAGLSVATYAAAKALVQASALAIVGLRVGSYLLAGGFLLFVAYWYRASEEAGDSQRDAGASRGAFRG